MAEDAGGALVVHSHTTEVDIGNLWPIGIASSYEAATRGQRVWADVAIHRQGTLWMGRGETRFDVADTDDGVLGVLRLLGFMVESNPFNPQLFDRRGTLSLELLLRGTRAGVTRVKLERMMVESVERRRNAKQPAQSRCGLGGLCAIDLVGDHRLEDVDLRR